MLLKVEYILNRAPKNDIRREKEYIIIVKSISSNSETPINNYKFLKKKHKTNNLNNYRTI